MTKNDESLFNERPDHPVYPNRAALALGEERPQAFEKQLRQLADSIRTFGFTKPVLIDGQVTILAGHGRVEAAKLLGWQTVPCVLLDHMTPEQKRAYVLAANEGLGPEEPGDPEDDALPSAAPRRCRPGDVWRLGRHRLDCGDALDPAAVDLLMDGRQARMVFTDPQHNVPIDGHVGGGGKTKHREFAIASGEMTTEQFTAFLERALRDLADHSLDGSIHIVCMDWRRAYLCELYPIYCDRILARWETYAKNEAEPVVCGWTDPERELEPAQ